MAILSSKLGKIITTLVVIILLVLGSAGYVAWYHLKREVPIVYDSIEEQYKYGSTNSGGIPYWIWVVLPRLFPENLPGPGGYTSVGFIWEDGQETPVGVSKTTIGFERQGVTCALCHSAAYRKSPEDTPTLVLGAPAQKFDSQANIRFLSACGRDPKFTADYILPAIESNHHLSWLEKQLYRYLLIPQTKKALIGLGQGFAWMNSRPTWGPGRIDPFNPVKFIDFGLPLDDTIGNSDFVPLWNKAQHKGFDYHWDGLDTYLPEPVIMGALAAGTKPDNLPLEDLNKIQKFIEEVPPPTFPFEVNQPLAAKGKPIFDQNCATCHAFGGDRTGTVIALEEVGTDRHRLDMWVQDAVEKYETLGDGTEWDFNHVQKTDGYVAVSLDGIWLRAPYLHNGSVPYLTDILEVPENRTALFYRGYDVYNPEKVGFVSEGTEATKEGFRYDITVEGNSNQGHLYGTELSTDDKKALVEYLKTL